MVLTQRDAVLVVQPETILRWRRGGRGNADDQALGRDDAIIGASTAALNQPMRLTSWCSGCRRKRLMFPSWLRFEFP